MSVDLLPSPFAILVQPRPSCPLLRARPRRVPRGRWTGFALNTETPNEEISGDEGVFNAFELKRMEETWKVYLGSPRIALLFRSPYVEDVRGKQGTGPNFEMAGGGTGEHDRGVRVYYEWVERNVGRWEYPRHVRE